MSGELNSKFTEPRIERALAALRLGCTRQAAAGAAEVDRVTFWRWMDDATFRNEVEKAEAQAEATFSGIVAEASIKNWTAAAWWLERRRPDDYGKRIAVDVSMRDEVTRLAAELGIDVDDAIAEAERVLAESR